MPEPEEDYTDAGNCCQAFYLEGFDHERRTY